LKEKEMTGSKGVLAAAVLGLALGGCAYHYGSGDYRGYQVRGEQSVRFGVVDSVRPVRINPRDTGLGAATGAIAGGIAGSNVGGGSGQIVGALGGAILGGVIGQNVEQSANERRGEEITVLLDSGKYLAVVQEADESFRPGDRVRVLSGRGTTRVTH
jgi:outer membrane lipoprotein SlyB